MKMSFVEELGAMTLLVMTADVHLIDYQACHGQKRHYRKVQSSFTGSDSWRFASNVPIHSSGLASAHIVGSFCIVSVGSFSISALSTS